MNEIRAPVEEYRRTLLREENEISQSGQCPPSVLGVSNVGTNPQTRPIVESRPSIRQGSSTGAPPAHGSMRNFLQRARGDQDRVYSRSSEGARIQFSRDEIHSLRAAMLIMDHTPPAHEAEAVSEATGAHKMYLLLYTICRP